MNQNENFKEIDDSLDRLENEERNTTKEMIKLTRVVTLLTLAMVLIGIFQLLITWPKRTVCITQPNQTIQICTPDYWPYNDTK